MKLQLLKILFNIILIISVNWSLAEETEIDVLEKSLNLENESTDINNSRIIGGKEATPNQFPYQVAMNILMDNQKVQVCGGVLVSNSWILTAAHCLYKASAAEIILGAHDAKNSHETTQKRIIVNKKNFIIHSEYPKAWVDIALIKLPISIPLKGAIQAIPLSCSKENQKYFIGKNVVVSGWGMTSDKPGSLSTKLKYTNIQIVTPETCKKFFGSKLTANLSHIYCAKGLSGTSTCSGDSGGPLVSLDKNGRPEKLIGLVSFGMIGGCTKGYPQGFVKVSSFLDWIAEKTGGNVRSSQC